MSEDKQDSSMNLNNSVGSNSEQNPDKSNMDLLSQMESKMNELYDFQYNIISNKVEYKEKPQKKYEPVNENEVYRRLYKIMKGVSMEKINILLGSKFVREYNPILTYFETIRPLFLENSESDPINEFLKFLKVDDPNFLEVTFKHWMVKSVASVFEKETYNKTIFVFFNSEQDSGKTTLARFIIPPKLKPYFVENDVHSKDGMINLYSRAFMLLDEMAAMSNSNISYFKSYISRETVDIRPPYDKQPVSRPRITNFLGTSDRQGFLPEDVGTARFLVHHIKKIDWQYSKKCNSDLMWSQALYLYGSNQNLVLSSETKAKITAVNKSFIESTVISEYISEILQPADREDGEFMQVKDILEYLTQFNKSIRLPGERKIGDALSSIGFKRESIYQTETKQSKYGFFVRKLSTRTKEN